MNTLSYKKDKKLLTFEAKGESYTLGSKLFPFSKKKNIGLWYSDNTQEPKRNERFLQMLDAVSNHTFISGKCYRNAEVVRIVGEKLGLNVKFYSGWMFSRDMMPIHHAWNVIDNRIIIDTSITDTHFRIQEKMIDWVKEQENDFSRQDYRERYVDVYEKEMNKRKPISQELLYGKPPEGYIYFGTEDTYLDSQDRLETLLEEINPHPAYLHYRNESGQSKTQEMLKERGLF